MTRSADPREPPGRALLAAGTTSYDHFEALEKVPASLRLVVETLKKMDFTTVAAGPGYSIDPELGDLRTAVRRAGNAANVVVVYYTGHGAHPERDSYYLVNHKSRPGDIVDSALRAADLPRLLLRRDENGDVEDVQPDVLIILDCCYSGAGGMEVLSDSLRGIGNKKTWVIASASTLEYAQQGVFASALCDNLRRPTTGPSTPFLSLETIVDAINNSTAGRAGQKARVFPPVAGAEGIPPFFPNPDHKPGVAGLTVSEQHWLSRLRGAPEETTTGFYLSGQAGRFRAAWQLARWMTDPGPGGLAMVTGSPGTGKSTLLALPVSLAQPSRRDELLRATRADSLIRRIAAMQSADISIVAVHARGLNTDQAASIIASGLGRGVRTASGLMEDLKTTPPQASPIVVVDAVDEAASPGMLLGSLLVPLARDAGLKVAVGARRHVLSSVSKANLTIDLDAEEYRDPGALVDYIHRLLVASEEPTVSTPYRRLRGARAEDVIVAVAEAIAQQATTRDGKAESFLIGRALALSVRGRAEPVDIADANWRAGLPTSLAEAFDEDLARMGDKEPLARTLLAALAWAKGPGLPWENLWVPVARAVAGASGQQGDAITNDEIRTLLAEAGSYVVEDLGPGQRSVYRPFHDLLAAHLRGESASGQADVDSTASSGWQERQSETELGITQALLSTLPTNHLGQRQWRSAHPYLRTYLVQHAAAAGPQALLSLVRDADFLAVADPATASSGLDVTETGLRDIARIYQRSRPLLGGDIHANAAYLQEAARALGGSSAVTEGDIGPLYRSLLASARQDDSRLTLTGHSDWVYSVAFGHGPDGRLVLASSGSDETIRIWDPAIGASAGEPLTGHRGVVESVALGPDDRGQLVLASGGWDRSVRLWDPATGISAGLPLTGHTGAVFCLAFGRDANGRPLLASGSSDHTVRLWDPVAGFPEGPPLTGHTGAVFCLAFGRDANGRPLLASGSSDHTVRLWDPVTGTSACPPLTGHAGAVRSVAFGTAPDGRPLLASGSSDHTVRLWDPVTGTSAGPPLTGHAGAVSSVAFGTAPDGRFLLASGSWDHTVRLWDPVTGTSAGPPLIGHTGAVSSVAFGTAPDGRFLLASGSWDHTVRVWDPVPVIDVSQPPTGHTDEVSSVAFGTAPDGRLLLASGSDDRTIRIWDAAAAIAKGQPLAGHLSEVCSVALGTDPHGRLLLASSSWDTTVRLWDPLAGTPIRQPLTGHTSMAIYMVAFGRVNGRLLLASAGDDVTVRLWDPLAGTPVGQPLTGHTRAVRAVTFLADPVHGSLLASASADRTVRLWDPLDGTQVGQVLVGHGGGVFALASGTGAAGQLLLASGSTDQTVLLWDPLTGVSVGKPLIGHTGTVRSVTFMSRPNGRQLLVSGSDDQTVRLWDTASGTCLYTLRRRSGVRSVASTGTMLAIGEEEGVFMIELEGSKIPSA